MLVLSQLNERAESKCELCDNQENLSVYTISPKLEDINSSVLICNTCKTLIENKEKSAHWRCLSSSMWSESVPVQVLSYRLLSQIEEAWSNDLTEQMYLEDADLEWAQSGIIHDSITKDSNGTLLDDGDSVTLIKDLVVKGANFTAKRGTLVKGISLTDNPLHIEGKVNGTKIVLVSAFLKKVN